MLNIKFQLINARQKIFTQKKMLKKLKDELLTKVNILPLSMMLAQATIESGWGLSRFAQRNAFCSDNGHGIKNRE